MGIAVAIFYLPCLAIVTWVAIFLGKRLGIKISNSSSKSIKTYSYVLGGSVAIAISWIAVFMVPVHGNTDWNAFVKQVIITLVTPISLGLTLVAISLLAKFINTKFSLFVNHMAVGAMYSTPITPLSGIIMGPALGMFVNSLEFSSLCKNGEITFVKHVPPASGIALLPDGFWRYERMNGVSHHSLRETILNNNALDFVERSIVNPTKDQKPYEKLTVVGDRVLSNITNDHHTKYLSTPIDNISADYVVTSQHLLPEKYSSGLGGARIEIRKREDNDLIAYAQYYWDNRSLRACPEDAENTLFIPSFIGKSLGIRPRSSD